MLIWSNVTLILPVLLLAFGTKNKVSTTTFSVETQLNDSCHRSRTDSAGKSRESHQIRQKNSGNRCKMEAVFRPFPGEKHTKNVGSHRKKIGEFLAGILLRCSIDFQCFSPGTGPYLLTWERITEKVFRWDRKYYAENISTTY